MAIGDEFQFSPSFSFQETIRFRTLISTGENGTEQRRAKWQNPLREFTMNHNAITQDTGANLGDALEGEDVDRLFRFYTNRQGKFDLFTFTSPMDGSNYTVRFAEDSLQRDNFIAKLFSVGVKLVEVRQ